MELLSTDEAYRAFPVMQDWNLALMECRRFQLGNEVDDKKLAARLVYFILMVPEPSCLLITERGIWPSSEWLFPMEKLFEFWSGQKTDFWDTPGIVFGPDDVDWIETFLFLSQVSIWGFKYAALSGNLVIEVDHHERLFVYSRDVTLLSQIVERFRHHDLFVIEPGEPED